MDLVAYSLGELTLRPHCTWTGASFSAAIRFFDLSGWGVGSGEGAGSEIP